jgi:hypothetical protein
MDTTLTLIDLAGSIALLLWGVHMVQSGIQRAFGPHLRRFLGRALRGRFAAFLAGLGVTAVLQSSTATGLMVAGFAAGGLVDLVPALAVMLGANVGTTLIVQLLSFDIGHVAPLFVLVGVILFRRSFASRTRESRFAIAGRFARQYFWRAKEPKLPRTAVVAIVDDDHSVREAMGAAKEFMPAMAVSDTAGAEGRCRSRAAKTAFGVAA